MLFVSFIFSLSANFDKISIINSDPYFTRILFFPLVSLGLFIYIMYKGKLNFSPLKKRPFLFMFMALFFLISHMSHVFGLQTSLVTLFISLKRTSTLWGLLLAYFVFKESRLSQHLIGGSLMVTGAMIIGYLNF